MERLETRELVYFATVAEELHFTRAAERLGIAPPPLSRAISRLERRMRVRLFERTSRRVSLTPAGEVFLKESRKALAAIDAAARRAQQAGRRHRLVVAARPGTGSGLLADVLRAYGQESGAAEVEIVFTRDQPAALRDGTAGIGLMCGDGDLDGLDTVELARERPVALLPATHRLAGRGGVTVAELERDEAYRAVCPAEGLSEIVDLVALGRLVVVVGASVSDRLGNAVVAVPVLDLPVTLLLLGWPRGVEVAARGAFVRTARGVAAESAALDEAG
ncbi:LysR family transcriptional regulator [Streptomyces sp. AK02-01A]|uniref:LysR family transcriptional regulator n=1 Tax=Streptomyces sp. AK02-01A TaxID=3028648 RepID=UPI0029BBADAA|nr:LysR family transcriptional regulator [Streptomyces sp. AK02-01A]MDX3853959.1 LysR family transcriptional regulator [Streptomyces sp. AK02-01A]